MTNENENNPGIKTANWLEYMNNLSMRREAMGDRIWKHLSYFTTIIGLLISIYTATFYNFKEILENEWYYILPLLFLASLAFFLSILLFYSIRKQFSYLLS